MKIAIQGELGSFSHQAAEAMLPGAKIVPCARSLEVFDRVARGTVGGAVIPIENSLAGSVAEHFDLLLSREVHIVREFPLRIVHNLIALPGTKFRDLRIASRRAAEVYGGKIVKAGIEDDKKNFTRFFLIERGKARATRRSGKISLAFSGRNLPGALFKALSVFALRDISLSKIESRPMRGRPWEYVFFVDLLRGDDEAARNALHHLEEVAELVKVLGIYPPA